MPPAEGYGPNINPDDLIDEQIAYYRARAPEYDQWWKRMGQFDLGDEFREHWQAEVAALVGVLDEFAPRGDVLEIAPGTGNWTVELLRHADRITAVDTSPEVLEINRGKAASDRVEYVVADVFEWEPSRQYDVAFFSFWLTHVPPGRFDGFWSFVARALKPEGRVFFIDNAIPLETVPAALGNWSRGSSTTEGGVSVRQLGDGREFTIVKVMWEPHELRRRLADLGWAVTVEPTGPAFLYGHGLRVS